MKPAKYLFTAVGPLQEGFPFGRTSALVSLLAQQRQASSH